MIKKCSTQFDFLIHDTDVGHFLKSCNTYSKAVILVDDWKEMEFLTPSKNSSYYYNRFKDELKAYFPSVLNSTQPKTQPLQASNDLHWNAIDKLSKIIVSRLA